MEKDPQLAAVTAVMNAVKIVCVTYTDDFPKEERHFMTL
jgi:hypothetical protein